MRNEVDEAMGVVAVTLDEPGRLAGDTPTRHGLQRQPRRMYLVGRVRSFASQLKCFSGTSDIKPMLYRSIDSYFCSTMVLSALGDILENDPLSEDTASRRGLRAVHQLLVTSRSAPCMLCPGFQREVVARMRCVYIDCDLYLYRTLRELSCHVVGVCRGADHCKFLHTLPLFR